LSGIGAWGEGEGARGKRGGGAEGHRRKNLYKNSPLLPCSPAPPASPAPLLPISPAPN